MPEILLHYPWIDPTLQHHGGEGMAECKVFAQGHAALCKYYEQLRELSNIILVDIGGYTVDVMTLHDFKVDRGSCASLRMGIITLFNDIRDEL